MDSIADWPVVERPREKLIKYGSGSLSVSELLAIILRTGVRGENAIDVGRRLLGSFKSLKNMSDASFSEYQKCRGLGIAKIAQLKAAFELGRRCEIECAHEEHPRVNSSTEAYKFFAPRMRGLRKESFHVMLLKNSNELIEVIEVEKGTVDRAQPIMREIFHLAIEKFAVSIICAHNHPSGSCVPSPEDRVFTRDLVKVGKIIQINVLDHLVVTDEGFMSMADHGLLEG